MKITILGCGHNGSTINGNNCILLEENRGANNVQRMLIDAGWDLPHMLKRGKVRPKDITDVYISHLHGDHIGGLEWLGFDRYDWATRPRPTKCNWDLILHANSLLMNEMWDHSLSGGMSSIEGIDATLETFFRLNPIRPNTTFEWCGWTFKLIQQIHIMSGSIITNTFGLLVTKPGHKTLYFVTDAQHCSPRQVEVFYREADIIFQDCELYPAKMMSQVHANYAQLAGYPEANSVKLSDDIKSKMWLTHYQDFYNDKKDFFGNECDWDALAEKDGFQGFVHVGQTFEV
jgi:ribonuclease BN (tRNA processing enzyme)